MSLQICNHDHDQMTSRLLSVCTMYSVWVEKQKEAIGECKRLTQNDDVRCDQCQKRQTWIGMVCQNRWE